ncbi:hypothetical protein BT69DRAFT_1323113 [Atractiella rhizophila]|nr:hypothetical protein BT69DRAFT_1323113 [Atractiella rhizophila]
MKTIPQTIRSQLANGKFPPPAFAIPNPADFFSIPSTPLTQKSIVLMENLLPKWGLNHCYRTFCYALAIAELTGWNKSPHAEELEWDREAIFLACILHDIGWDEKDCIRDDAKLSRLSFEIFGGIKAREGLLKWGATHEFLTLAGKEWTHKPGCLFEKEREPVAAFLTENLDHWRELDGEREAEELKANWRERRLRVDLDSMTLDGVPF